MTSPLTVTSLKDVPRRVLKESQLRECKRLVKKHGKSEALAIFKRDLILRNGNEWWTTNRVNVLAELDKFIQNEETK